MKKGLSTPGVRKIPMITIAFMGVILAIIIIASLASGCKSKANTGDLSNVRVDTVYVHHFDTDTVYIDRYETIEVIPQEYLEYKLIVLNVKHYVSITEANPSNQKYFYGWIRRAVAE